MGDVIFIRLVIAYLLMCSQFAYSKPDITIYTEQFPPYNFSNKGELQGINLDIVRDLCEQVKVECKFELLPWLRAYNLVQKDPYAGLVSTARSPERESLFHWIGPLVASRTFFYRLAENEHINPTDLSQITNYSLGVVRGNIYEQLVEEIGFVNDKNLLKFSHRFEYLNLFFKKKIDLIFGSELTLDYQLQQFGYGDKKVVKLVELPMDSTQGNYLVLNKSMPKELVQQFKTQLIKLQMIDNFDTYRDRYYDYGSRLDSKTVE